MASDMSTEQNVTCKLTLMHFMMICLRGVFWCDVTVMQRNALRHEPTVGQHWHARGSNVTRVHVQWIPARDPVQRHLPLTCNLKDHLVHRSPVYLNSSSDPWILTMATSADETVNGCHCMGIHLSRRGWPPLWQATPWMWGRTPPWGWERGRTPPW